LIAETVEVSDINSQFVWQRPPPSWLAWLGLLYYGISGSMICWYLEYLLHRSVLISVDHHYQHCAILSLSSQHGTSVPHPWPALNRQDRSGVQHCLRSGSHQRLIMPQMWLLTIGNQLNTFLF